MNVVEVKKLSKYYRVSHQLTRNSNPTLRDDLRLLAKKPLELLGAYHGYEREKFWALKDISFNVEQGDVVGIMGRNGSGKSTLFKILSKITYPTSGEAFIRGHVASLLEVGTGFHPELTGRENVYLNGSILGMKKSQIEQRFDEIVAFSEVEKFLDMPVKFYSSGMVVRLAFSVAAHIDPEILLVDEVLAVGDVRFKQKSLAKMKQVAQGGATVLFISHQVGQIEQICTRGIVLNDGVKKFDGELEPAIETYLDLNAVPGDQLRGEEQMSKNSSGLGMANVKVETSTRHGLPDLTVRLDILNKAGRSEDLVVGVVLYDEFDRNITALDNQFIDKRISLTKDKAKLPITIHIKDLNLIPDRYNVRLILRPAGDSGETYQRIEKAASLKLPEYSWNAKTLETKHGSAPPVVFDYDYDIG